MPPAVLFLYLLLVVPVRAGTAVSLPPGELPEAWGVALAEARQLVPDLEVGSRAPGTPGVDLLATTPLWGVRVTTRDGECPVFPVLPPSSDSSRREVLVLAAYVLETSSCMVPAPPPSREAPWLRVAGTADLVNVGVGWKTNFGIQFGRRIGGQVHALGGVRSATSMIRVEAQSVGVRGVEAEAGIAWHPTAPASEGGVRASATGGVACRWYDGDEIVGAWVPWVETSFGARLPLPGEGVHADAGLAWSTDLPAGGSCAGWSCVDPAALRLVLGLEVDLAPVP